jgi:hypothetical protein
MARRSVPPFVGDGMCVRRVLVPAPQVVFFKGVLEAHEGLAQVFAEHGGELTVACPNDRASELDRVLADLLPEVGGLWR